MEGFNECSGQNSGFQKVGVGVIGHGFMGKVHSNAYLKIPYSYPTPPAHPDLVALCGRNEEGVRDVALRMGAKGYYTDWEKMLADSRIQMVDVCTPDDRHEAPSGAAAEAGKHVICEKPLAMTVAAAKAMRDAAVKAGVKHMLCHNYRFIPAVRLAKQQGHAVGLPDSLHGGPAFGVVLAVIEGGGQAPDDVGVAGPVLRRDRVDLCPDRRFGRRQRLG